jgi:AbiV family abortive infection protein
MNLQMGDSDHLRGQTAIIENAARLLGDAKFLSDNGRFASAFALAVLAIEEIGKVILEIWDTPRPLSSSKNRWSSHLQKQMAIAALLLAKKAVEEAGDAVIGDPISEELVERVAKAMCESSDGRFTNLVTIGALDKTKQLALYRDRWFALVGLHPNQFKKADVTELFDKARGAIASVGEPKIMRAGRAIYELQLQCKVGPSRFLPR